jgi:hypothetical protein
MTEARDNKGNVKCGYCGGYTYKWPSEGSPFKCPACDGTGVSQKPSHRPPKAKGKTEDLDLP